MKILNLYAGIGGNRKNWDGEKHGITAVEINEEIAEEYKRLHPTDKVVVQDAHVFLKQNYQDYDFIWSSPPCPTHSWIRKAGTKNEQYDAEYPEMKLWQEIIFLKHYAECPWVVENVKPYYEDDVEFDKSDLFVKPQESARHYFWSNFNIPEVVLPVQNINQGNCEEWRQYLGMHIKSDWRTIKERKVLRNAVHPRIGEAILKARNTRQTKLAEVNTE
jgi:DNA (cytosine-5)-methyltransferase 1